MRIYKVYEGLWRVANNGKVKDVKVIGDKIIPPENDYNILTPVEQMEMEMKLF